MMNKNIEKTMSEAKAYPSFVNMKQRIVAAFTALILLLQICFPTIAYAVMLVSDDSIVATMSQAHFKLSTSNSYLYEQADYQDASFANTKHINTFYNDLIAAGINVAGAPVGKPIGDVYVQSRYIRQQIIEQIGRHLINTADNSVDEIQQINNLYATAKIFAASNGTYKYGDNLPASLKIESNMIWPEKRTINGEQVMVPIAYLAHTTVVDNSVNNNKTEFKSGVATFKKVTLDQTTLTTGTNTVLQTGELLLSGGTITSPGALTLVVGGTLQNLSGSIRTESDLNIIATQVANKTTVIPFVSKYGSGTHLGKVANIEAGGNLTIKSYGDIAFEGATAQAVNGAITFNANGNINLQPAATQTQSEYQSGHWKVNESTLELLQSKLGAENTITLMAGGTITIAASELHSTKGGIELLAKHGIYIADEQGHFQSNRVDKIGKTRGTGSDFESFAIRSVLSAGKGILLETEAGAIELKGAKITSAEGTQVKATNGKVRLLVTKENSQHYLDTVRTGKWTIKTVHEEYVQETGIPNAIVGGLAVEALLGVDIEYAGREGANLKDQIDEYKKMPDTMWMADIYEGRTLFKNAQGNLVPLNQIVDFSKVTEAYTHIRNVDRSLSPAAMALLTIVIAVASGGASLSGQSFLSSAMSAGFTTLEVQAASSLLAGNSIEQTLKNMSSSESLKNLAISMATAGALNELGDLELFNKAQVTATPQLAFVNQAYQAVANSVVTAGISVTINGGNSDDYLNAFKVSLATSAINSITKSLAQKIGAAAHLPEDQRIDVGVQYIAHAAVGCLRGTLTARINGSDTESACYSGAGGAVIGEAVGKYFASKLNQDLNSWVESQLKNSGEKPSDETQFVQFQLLQSQGADLAQLSAALVAFATGGDVDVASGAGMNAAQNNAMYFAKKLEEFKAWHNAQPSSEYLSKVAEIGENSRAIAIARYNSVIENYKNGTISRDTYEYQLYIAEDLLASAHLVPVSRGEFIVVGLETAVQVGGVAVGARLGARETGEGLAIEVINSEKWATAKATINGEVFTDVNQTRRVNGRVDEPTLIYDYVNNRTIEQIAKGKSPTPNANMKDAHAEVGTIQQAYNAGKTQNANMTMTVSGEPVCGYCLGDIPKMANKAGLKTLTIFEEITGDTLFWTFGDRTLKSTKNK